MSPTLVMLMQQTAIFSTSWTTKTERSEEGPPPEGTTNNGKPRVVSTCIPASEALPGWLDSHHMQGIPGRARCHGTQRTHPWRVQSHHRYQWEVWIPGCQGILFHVLQQTDRVTPQLPIGARPQHLHLPVLVTLIIIMAVFPFSAGRITSSFSPLNSFSTVLWSFGRLLLGTFVWGSHILTDLWPPMTVSSVVHGYR